MSIVPEEPGTLADLRDALAQGHTLQSADACLIGRGFVACNLLIDLADLLVPVIRQEGQKIAGEIACRQLYPCLLGGAPEALAAAIDALPEEEALLREHHPWRVVNQWLFLEALARIVDHRDRRPGQVALEVFEQILADSVPVEICCRRGEPVRKAFGDWFEAHAGKLVRWLHNLRWELVTEGKEGCRPLQAMPSSELRAELVRRLAHALDAQPVVRVTTDKNAQLQSCLGRIRAADEPPEALPAWIRRLYNAMKDAEECRQDFSLDASLLEVLQQLVAWVRQQGLLERGGVRLPILQRLAGVLDQFSGSWAKHPGALTLSAVMAELKELADLIRKPGLPAGGPGDRHVEDLFSHPMKAGFRFSAWREKVLGCGLGRS